MALHTRNESISMFVWERCRRKLLVSRLVELYDSEHFVERVLFVRNLPRLVALSMLRVEIDRLTCSAIRNYADKLTGPKLAANAPE